MTGSPHPDVRRVASALAALAPEAVRTGALAVDPRHLAACTPAELSAVDRAVDRRREQFATGRVLLRRLLGTSEEILVGPGGRALLPVGSVGSLAHDAQVAVAAVGWGGDIDSVGVDVELLGSMTSDEADLVRRSEEHSLDPRLVFTLKEAVYKAWSGLGGGLLDFHDVRVDARDGSFDAEVVAAGTRISGRYATSEGRWLALAVVGADLDGVGPVGRG